MRNRFAAAKKFATDIIRKNKLSPPINPRDIIDSFNIKIIEESNNYGIEAYSSLNDAVCITINPEFTFPARKNFTLAHELGHIVIPWHNGDVKCDTDTPYIKIDGQHLIDTQELEANIFASELLIPSEWVKSQIPKDKIDLKYLIESLQKSANTSIMACMYSLEGNLPPGNIFFVRKISNDYWHKFTSHTSATTLFYNIENNINFFNTTALYSQHFNISYYEVYYYNFAPCPDCNNIQDLYQLSNKNIVRLINDISDSAPLSVIPYIDYILKSVGEKYSVFVFQENTILKRISPDKSMIKLYDISYEKLLQLLIKNNITYEIIDSETFKFIFIPETLFEIPKVKRTDPNSLLQIITKAIAPTGSEKLLHSINGIVASANSNNKTCSSSELYNIIKYRFLFDEKYDNFKEHPYYETYIVNKVISMINRRKQ